MKEAPNLYPLWEIIDYTSKRNLVKYQHDTYGTKITIPKLVTADEVPVDWDKELRKAPSRSRE